MKSTLLASVQAVFNLQYSFFLVAAIPDFTGFENLSPEDREELAQDLADSGIDINDFIQESSEQLSQNLQDSELPFNDLILGGGSEQLSQNLQKSGLALNELIQESIAQRDSIQQKPELVNDEDNIGLNSVFIPPTGFPEGTAPPEPFEVDLGGGIPILTGADDCVTVPWSNFLGERLGTRALEACQKIYSDNGVT